MLKGLIYGPDGTIMTPTHTRRHERAYRYYISAHLLKHGNKASPMDRIPAGEIERAVIDQVAALVRTPEIIVATWKAAKETLKGITELRVREALHAFEALWTELFPVEQARIVQLLVERIDLTTDGAAVTLRVEGLSSLVADIEAANTRKEAA